MENSLIYKVPMRTGNVAAAIFSHVAGVKVSVPVCSGLWFNIKPVLTFLHLPNCSVMCPCLLRLGFFLIPLCVMSVPFGTLTDKHIINKSPVFETHFRGSLFSWTPCLTSLFISCHHSNSVPEPSKEITLIYLQKEV